MSDRELATLWQRIPRVWPDEDVAAVYKLFCHYTQPDTPRNGRLSVYVFWSVLVPGAGMAGKPVVTWACWN